MVTTSTHDTKRGEDARIRIALLSQVPDAWEAAVKQWASHNKQHRSGAFPDRAIEYLYYQTLVGTWPIDAARMWPYIEKAAREAKAHTSWTDPDPVFESALKDFVEGSLGDAEFCADVERFVASILPAACVASLAQTLVKLTAPGVPDLYQGSELWDLNLVDPDNRRPVDFAARRRLWRETSELGAEEAFARCADGAVKLWLIRRTLRFRRERAECFSRGASYEALRLFGVGAERTLGYARAGAVAVVVPRLVSARGFDEACVELPPGSWKNELTGERWSRDVPLSQLLRRFPVALLGREASEEDREPVRVGFAEGAPAASDASSGSGALPSS
jgi:(1->4)-alpha-D-glucan 1-alpha-D-glucosylmutase